MAIDDMFGPGVPTLDPRAAAQAAVRAYCGWHVAPVIEETFVRDGNGRCTLVIPSRKVLDVTRVTVSGVDVTDRVRWSEAGMLEGVEFTRAFRAVEVELRHGFSPGEVADVVGVLERAAKRFDTDPRVRSQAVAGASVSYATTSSGGALSHLLTEDERAALDQYRITWGI